MITHISIKNFAIIESSEVEFNPGLNIITGETGAGKSIVIEAVSLALGARADSTFVRTGTDKAVVQIVGELDGEEIIITREVSAAGKNLCKLNGNIVTLAELGTYCRRLADIHGQYDHQSLLNPEYHIRLIDLYHSREIEPVLSKVSELYSKYTAVNSELKKLRSAALNSEKKRDFLRFQLDEINAADLKVGEEEDLAAHIKLLENSEKIYSSLAESYDVLYDSSPGALDVLKNISSDLSRLNGLSADIDSIHDRLESVCFELEDISREIRSERDSVTFSQQELDESIARYDLIRNLIRKYGNELNESDIQPGTVSAVLAYADSIRQELDIVVNQDKLEAELSEELIVLTQQLSLASGRLSELRKISADELTLRIEAQLKDLSFNNAQLRIEFETLPAFTESGTDSVQFMISTNLGEPLKPLNKIASGGEMSRIMLAFKKIVADYDSIPTLIFDEIDSGISGVAASVVGKKLKEIAENHQIICITHLPQIAACGHHNYRIQKSVDNSSTHTSITLLDEDEKADEIARLLGGSNITSTTLASARELIAASR